MYNVYRNIAISDSTKKLSFNEKRHDIVALSKIAQPDAWQKRRYQELVLSMVPWLKSIIGPKGSDNDIQETMVELLELLTQEEIFMPWVIEERLKQKLGRERGKEKRKVPEEIKERSIHQHEENKMKQDIHRAIFSMAEQKIGLLRLSGFNREEICSLLDISKRQYDQAIQSIKENL